MNLAGPKWGRYFVGPIQFMVCYGAVVACTLLGGQCMKVTSYSKAFSFSHTLWAKVYLRPSPKHSDSNICEFSLVLFFLIQAIYLLSNPNGIMKLYEFVVIFGCFMLILAQIPSFHSLRHINLVSLVLSLTYSACATAASIHIGKWYYPF